MKNIILKLTLFSLLVGNYCYSTQSKPRRRKSNKTKKKLRTIQSKRKKHPKVSILEKILHSIPPNENVFKFGKHTDHIDYLKRLEKDKKNYATGKHLVNCCECEAEDFEVMYKYQKNLVGIMHNLGLLKGFLEQCTTA